MDQPTNPLERILDLAHSDNNLFSLLQQENSYHFEPFSLFGCNEAKNQQKNQFFAQSPNPFKKERKNSHQLAFQFKPQNIRSQENFFNRKINFDEEQNILKWFSGQRQSQVCFPQGLFSPKKRDYQQFASPHKQESIQKGNFQVQSRFLKNERGLKNLSEGMYEVLKKTEKITFNEVASELIKDIKQKATQEGKQMLQKDEKNIRRRAYDALNVLISAGVIEKIDKFIALNKKFQILKSTHSHTVKSKKLVSLKELHSQLQEKVQNKNLLIQKKKQDLKTLIQRRTNIEMFFKQKKISQQTNDNQKIRFPFLYIKTSTDKFKGLSEQFRSKHQSDWQKQNSLTCDEKKGRKCVFLNFGCKDIFEGVDIIEGDIDFAANAGKLIRDKEDINVE